MGVPLGLNPDRGFDDVLDRGTGDAPLNPVERHPLRRIVPDLFVIGEHVALGYPLSKGCAYPLGEVFRGRDLPFLSGDERLDELVDAEEEVVLRQVGKAVLEGIFYELPSVEDLCIPGPPADILPEHSTHEREHLRIPREDDMRSSDIEGETGVGSGAAQATDPRFAFQNHHVIPTFLQEAGEGYSRQPSAEYCIFHVLIV